MMYIKQAKAIAENICEVLKPYCKVIDIAGSVRRNKQEVKDIEICCIPKIKIVDSNDLFQTDTLKIIIHPEFVKIVKDIGKAVKGKPDGKYMQIETKHNINLDLFMPDDFDYYRQLVIRTGPAEYSHRVIANAWRRMGWCGSDKGLRMTNDCTYVPDPKDPSKGKWVCSKENAYKPPVWRSEQEFFEWLNVPYLKPEKRYA